MKRCAEKYYSGVRQMATFVCSVIFYIKFAYLLRVLLFYMCIHTFQVFNANPTKISLRLEILCA